MNKLQELTDKLYNEGLSKGKQEAEEIVANAKAEAEKILANAKAEAETIIGHAKKDAADYRSKVEGDVKLASVQSLQELKTSIENMIVSSAIDTPVAETLSSVEFVKGIIAAVAEKFSANEPQDLSIVVPEKIASQIEPFVTNELAKTIGKGVSVSSKKISGGFQIGPKDGSYFIRLDEETFKALIGDYLRPTTKKILFGE